MVTTTDSQTVFTLDTTNVKLDAVPLNGFLRGHMTQGWNGSDIVGDALTCTATVPATDDDNATFGFIQIARATDFFAFYSGRIKTEGSIALNYFTPPALDSKILLDYLSSSSPPWYSTPTFGTAAGHRRMASFGDHPGLVVPLTRKNRVKSEVPNYLFHTFMEREFFTIFAVDPGDGKRRYIAYFQWIVHYSFKVKWVGGVPSVRQSDSFFTVVTQKTMGAPGDSDLQAMLSNPSGTRAPALGKRCQIMTESGTANNRSDRPDPFPTVPADFWS